MSSNNIAHILEIDDARVDELIQLCYKKLADVRLKKSDHPISEVIEYMNDVGKTDKEKFISGFILGRIYQSNLTELERNERGTAQMFG
jgi:hypothetical protein